MGDAGDIAEKPTGDARRFAAFISYSHADAAAAAKLQRKLERYHLPKRIAETRASDATALGPIFRDREDLAAAASLSDAIREAIARADALVVMCSPHAASSPWVAAEIELFRELHPQKPILAAILSSEPTIAFPPALTVNGNEPLAADLRPEGDGAQLGFLKIVAGIAGVPLDSLIQRDAQRRIRRVTAITGGALAAMLIMGIMTTLALQARNEAAQQRAAAEGLVEYMLTDLREKLRGVGRLDVMDAVNERAMQHYRRQGALADLPADSLERRARILHAMGEDDEVRDKLVPAAEKFLESHSATKALLARDPKNPERIFAHAQSEYWIGRVAERSSDWPVAMNHYAAYAAAAQQLISIKPNSADYMMEMAWGNLNTGIVKLQSRQKPDFGESSFKIAIGWMKKALAITPGDTGIIDEIGNAHAWLADSFYLRKDFANSLESRQRELAAKKWVSDHDVKNMEAKFQFAKAQYATGASLLKLGKAVEGTALLKLAENQMKVLVKLEPENREWRLVSQQIRKLNGGN